MKIKKSIIKCTVVFLLASALSVCLLELGLRITGFVYLKLTRKSHKQTLNDEETYRILCLGESTTALGKEDSYPDQLGQILNSYGLKKKFLVINAGVPAIDTSYILHHLKANLKKYHPNMVVAMMGVNDYEWKRKSAYEHLKVIKLWRYLKNEAIAPNQDFLALFDEGEDIYYKLGKLLLYFKQNKTAKSFFLKSIKNNYKFVPAYRALVECLEFSRDFIKQAENISTLLANINKDNYLRHYFLFNCYIKNGEKHKADMELKKAEKILNAQDELGNISLKEYLDLADFYRSVHVAYVDEEKAKEFIYKAWYKKETKNYASIPELYAKDASDGLNDLRQMFWQIGFNIPDPNDAGVYFMQKENYETAKKIFKLIIVSDFSHRIRQDACKNLALCYKKEGNILLAQVTQNSAEMFSLFYHKNQTAENYREIRDILFANKIKFVCVQYPCWDIKELSRILGEDQDVIYVDNEMLFKEKIKEGKRKEYFSDNFAGDFGHCTKKGNYLLAENIAKSILSELNLKYPFPEL